MGCTLKHFTFFRIRYDFLKFKNSPLLSTSLKVIHRYILNVEYFASMNNKTPRIVDCQS